MGSIRGPTRKEIGRDIALSHSTTAHDRKRTACFRTGGLEIGLRLVGLRAGLFGIARVEGLGPPLLGPSINDF